MKKYNILINKNLNNSYDVKIVKNINLNIVVETMLFRNPNLKDFRKSIKLNSYQKYNINYHKKENKYDYILTFDALFLNNKYSYYVDNDTTDILNIIMIDRFHLGETTKLRRLYFGNYSNYYAIKIPYQENRAEKLVNNYGVEFNKNFKCNKQGVIIIAPNCIKSNWFYKNKETLGTIESVKKIINIIKKYNNLDIELRLHPKDKNLKIIKTLNLKINEDDINTLSNRAYCIICDRSSIGTKLYLKGNIIFNLQTNFKYSIIGNICLTDPNLLNPNNLDINQLCINERYEYLKEISMLAYTYEEINNGYLLDLLYPLLVNYKNKVKII